MAACTRSASSRFSTHSRGHGYLKEHTLRHATWTAIEASPFALRAYRSYRRLPSAVRAPLRWMTSPRWHLAAAWVHYGSGNTVLSGPFAGTKLYLSPLSGRHLLGYLLGTQEIELHGAVEGIVSRRYATIINIGAADGYYALGLARRLPQAGVLAFEANSSHHKYLNASARVNGVAERIFVRGFCSGHELRAALATIRKPALVICDIEGGEVDLLDPESIGDLRSVDLLVETHDQYVANCTEILKSRFVATHAVQQFSGRPRGASDFPKTALPLLARTFPQTAIQLMNERRKEPQQWLLLTAGDAAPRPHHVAKEMRTS
jgi:hypothetical protein